MNPTFAALLGALIGGVLSVIGSWLAQQVQSRSKLLLEEIDRRQELYSEFIDVAARCYGAALRNNEVDFTSLTKLYGKIGRIRLQSSETVLREATIVAHKILGTYAEDNRTEDEIRSLLSHDSLDLLSDFGHACRAELKRLQHSAESNPRQALSKRRIRARSARQPAASH